MIRTARVRKMPPLILASGSPRRAALMREHGYDVKVIPPPLKEPTHLHQKLAPAHLAQALSLFKACSVRDQVERGWILAGDTIASCGDKVFGKPTDRHHAGVILRALSRTTHSVITGVTLLDAHDGHSWTTHDETAITMKPLTDDDIEAYLDTGEWKGKAGAYGIQDRGDAFVVKIEGSFSNVVGFPMELIGRMLADWSQPEANHPRTTRRPGSD